MLGLVALMFTRVPPDFGIQCRSIGVDLAYMQGFTIDKDLLSAVEYSTVEYKLQHGTAVTV